MVCAGTKTNEFGLRRKGGGEGREEGEKEGKGAPTAERSSAERVRGVQPHSASRNKKDEFGMP